MLPPAIIVQQKQLRGSINIMKIYQVLRVFVVKISENPLTLNIRAEGLAATSGWTNPRLDN